MSAEHNASRSPVRRNDSLAQNANTSSNANDTFEEAAGSADNSIIGKVKSRVSSIIPSSFSKWFSPSTRNNDSLNGNVSIGSVRRRRRIELEDDDEDADDDGEEDDDAEQTHGAYVEHSLGGGGEQDTDEESNNSEEDSAVIATSPVRSVHRHVKPPSFGQQPPTKRSRISFDVTDMHDSPLMQHQPLISSTPAVASNIRGGTSNLYSPSGQQIQARGAATNRYSHLNLYGRRGVEEAPCNFLSTDVNAAQQETRRGTADIIDLVANPGSRLDSGTMRNETNDNVMGISNRRTLNLPSTSHAAAERYSTGGPTSLKRQSLASVKYEMANAARENYHISPSAAVPSRTSTTILEIEAGGSDDDEVLAGEVSSKFNGRPANHIGSKRQKLINGTGGEFTDTVASGHMDGDSASESSEGGGVKSRAGAAMPDSVTTQRKPGLFNMSATHSRNGSRTSSFGNGINFYSHLEGRKSLFSGYQHGAGVGGNTLNNSTLSLTSLNRRQFNASIYGSTSALSDSRLLSTFSPFYKGKTTYGGAAAYNKYTTPGIAGGPGANAVRITPTLIRPTSSLSTLSSSNNSLAATGGAGTSAGVGGEGSSAISSTAKRILDLINDFATPLSDAKKMANNLKTNQQQPQLLPQAKGKSRLSDADVHAARAVRLQQVRTPYMRPAVMLQPTKGVLLPPVRELQVPSMSQLLQMKKMQSSTERARQIATQNNSNAMRIAAGESVEYALPVAVESSADGQRSQLQNKQQKHTNKIKSKLSASARITSSKDAADLAEDEPPPPVNLPNIAFPLMQAVPKFDIALPSVPVAATVTTVAKDVLKGGQDVEVTKSRTFDGGDKSGAATLPFNINNNKPVGDRITTATTTKQTAMFASTVNANVNATTVTMNFKFSAPLEVKGSTTPTQFITPIRKNYTFSAPATIAVPTPSTASDTYSAAVKSPMMVSVPPLKSGSVLDALKPYTLSSTAATTATTTSSSTISVDGSFGDQFKKSSGQWECHTCLVRNTPEMSKCVACETPRSTTKTPSAGGSTASLISSFGSQFKKSDSEWECDACMVRNKQDTSKCIACETPRNGATNDAITAAPLLPPIGNSFGNAFKTKANTWECPTCLIHNKNECNECVACCTKKPGAASTSGNSGNGSSGNGGSAAPAPSTTFKFGFTPFITSTVGISTEATAATAADAGFKSLAAAQKAAKWECEACMTRNDAARQKCVCCEQAKPGTQTVSEAVPKFAFGTTAASKFTFGFGTSTAAASTNGTAATTATITTHQKTEESTVKSGFVFGSAKTVTAASGANSGGFTFGIKPTTTIAIKNSEASKSAGGGGVKTTTASDSNTSIKFGAAATTGPTFSFGLPASKTADSTTSVTTSTTTTTTPAPPSVKFSLSSAAKPDTTDGLVSDKPSTAKTFAFGSVATTTSTANSTGSPSNKTAGGFTFGTPVKSTDTSKVDGAAPGFAFKLPTVAAATSSTAAAGAFGTPTTTTTTAAIKPMFSFGSTTPTPSAATTAAPVTINNTTACSTTATLAAGGFNFSTSSTPAKTLFGGDVSSAAAVTAAAATPTTATSQTSNVFGSFGASGSVGFGNAASAVKAPTSTTTATTSTTFGTFCAAAPAASAAASATTNVFGQSESKPIASATPIFGSVSGTVAVPVTNSSSTTSTPFVFGSASSMANNSGGGGSTNNNTGGTANSWPKNSFIFGASTAPASNASTTVTSNEAPKSVFGSFGAAQSVPASAAPSIFGNMTSTGTNTQSTAPPTFGSAASSGATNIFGSAGSTTVASPASGVANVFGSNSAPPPAFGSTTFGSSSSGVNSATVFGASAAGQNAAFGGFGAAAPASTTTNDGASAAKKSEPAFNFGGNSTHTTNQQGSFNFGSNAGAAKPAFNFGVGSTPAFNFTGGVETQAVKPFEFGSTPLAPVFNFSGGAVEATPNAPFQFNAGAAPASNNIFAPAPTPGVQSAQQARRKIRQPTRRLTPR